MARLVMEWVNVTGDISIIARESGEVWFHTPSGTKDDVDDPFATPMTGVGALEELQQVVGEALPYLHSSRSSHGEERGPRPAA
jgi:hypothetical protein